MVFAEILFTGLVPALRGTQNIFVEVFFFFFFVRIAHLNNENSHFRGDIGNMPQRETSCHIYNESLKILEGNLRT